MSVEIDVLMQNTWATADSCDEEHLEATTTVQNTIIDDINKAFANFNINEHTTCETIARRLKRVTGADWHVSRDLRGDFEAYPLSIPMDNALIYYAPNIH